MQKTTLFVMFLFAMLFVAACDTESMDQIPIDGDQAENDTDPTQEVDGDEAAEAEPEVVAPAIRITMTWSGRMDMDLTVSKKRECGTWAVPAASVDLVGRDEVHEIGERWKKPCNTDDECETGYCTEYFSYSADGNVKYCTTYMAAAHDDTVGYLSLRTSWGVKDMDDVGCHNPNDPCTTQAKEGITIPDPKQGDVFRVAAYYNAANSEDGNFVEPTGFVEIAIVVNGIRCERTFLASFDEVREAVKIADIAWKTGTCEDVAHLPGWQHFIAPDEATPLDPMSGTGSFWCDDVYDKACAATECPTATTN